MKFRLNRFIAAVIMLMAILPPIAPQTFADDPVARTIMEKVDARDDGDNQTSDMEMILIDKNQKQQPSFEGSDCLPGGWYLLCQICSRNC